MQVECASRGQFQNRIAEQMTVIERENNVGSELTDTLGPDGVVDVIRGVDRDPRISGQARNGAKKCVFSWVIRMCKNGGNVITGVEHGLYAQTPHIVIREDNGFHC